MTRFPATTYQPLGLYDGEWANVGDFTADLVSAASEAVDAMDKGWITAFRVLRLDFDLETGAPETFRDVTEEAKAAARDWITARAQDIPGWLDAA